MQRSPQTPGVQGRGLWLIVLAASLWGTVGPITQGLYGLADTTPLTINFFRMGIAAPVLLLACWRLLGRRMFQAPRRDFAVMMFVGVLLALDQAAYFVSISYAGAAVATLLVICAAPVLVALASVTFYREPLTPRIVLSLAVAVLGTALLVDLQAGASGNEDALLGVFFGLLSAVGYAGVILVSRTVAGRYHPLQVTAIGFTAGTVLLLVLSLATGFKAGFPAEGWLLVVYLGIVPTAIAYGLFLAGLRSTPAAVASVAVLLEPLVATALAWIVFGESLGPAQFLGAVLLCSAILLLTRSEQPQPQARTPADN